MPQVQLNNFKMHYVERGTGPEPNVFGHGCISARRWWLPTIERLSKDDYQTYAIDLRAAGLSEQIETGHTLTQYADECRRPAPIRGCHWSAREF